MVRPSARLIKPLYFIGFIAAAVIYGFANNQQSDDYLWLLIAPALLVVWAFFMHLRLRFTTLTVGGNRLRLESGFLSKSTRAMELSKVQDVQVRQTLMQRMLGLGDLSIETAAESASLAVRNVERPHAIADFILDKAHR